MGTFSLTVGETVGEMKIVFPVATLDPLKEALKDLLNVSKSKQGMWTEILENEVSKNPYFSYTSCVTPSTEKRFLKTTRTIYFGNGI